MPYYLINVITPEGVVDTVQAWGGDPGEALAKVRAYHAAAGTFGPNEQPQYTVRDSMGSPFSNQMIGSGPQSDKGSHNPAGQYHTPDPTGDTKKMATNFPTGLQEQDPYALYENYYDIPTFGASPLQRWQAKQAGATIGAWKLMQRYNPTLQLSDYLGRTGIEGARNDVNTEYDQLLGLDRDVFGARKEAAGNEWNPIMREVIARRQGRAMADVLAPSLGLMQRKYEATPEGFDSASRGGSDLSFLKDYLRSRWGI